MTNVAEKVRDAKAIIRSLDNDLTNAIACRAMFSFGAYESEINTLYDNTYECWGYNISLRSYQLNQISSLMRIYDTHSAADTASLPNLFKLLDVPGVLDELQAEARAWHDNVPTYYLGNAGEIPDAVFEEMREERRELRRQRNAEVVLMYIEEAKQLFEKQGGSHIVGRLQEFRHKVLAHSSINAENLQLPKNSYADDLLDRVIPIIEKLRTAICGEDFNYEDAVSVWADRAKRFWTTAAPEEAKTLPFEKSPC